MGLGWVIIIFKTIRGRSKPLRRGMWTAIISWSNSSLQTIVQSTIPGKGEAYIDIESSPNASPLGDVGLNFGKYGEHFAQIEINNNGAFPVSLGTIKIFVE